MFDKEFLLLKQCKNILSKSDIAKINIEIISNYFRALNNNCIFVSLYKDIYVTKI